MNPALDQLAELASMLKVAGEQRRILGSRIIAVAGSIGHIKPDGDADLVIHVRRPALSDAARQSARALLDAGVIEADASDRLLLARMPSGTFECNAMRQVLGLYSGYGRMSA